MAHSVEGRVPFLDHHVVELCRDLPVSQKIRGVIQKHVLREAARSVLPAPIYRRRKHGLVAPPAALVREGRLFELVHDTLRGTSLAALPFFDQAKVVALLDELPTLDDASRTAYDQALMILLSACALQTGYGLS
jgi:asparagine synthase (glutamine-hydrolysing)